MEITATNYQAVTANGKGWLFNRHQCYRRRDAAFPMRALAVRKKPDTNAKRL